jgi:alpha-tubulin suppressor-like RCC1 family protein
MKTMNFYLLLTAWIAVGCSQVIPPGQPGYDSGVTTTTDGTGSNGGTGSGSGTDGTDGSTGDGTGNGNGTGTGTSSPTPTPSPSATVTATQKLAILTATQSIVSGTCSSPIVVKTENSIDNSSYIVQVDTLITLSGNNIKFYSDQNCTIQITNVTIAAQTSIASFYFSGTIASSPVVVASSSNYNQASEGQSILPGTPTSILIATQPSNGTISNQIFKTQPVVRAYDQYLNLASNAVGAVTATAYSDSVCIIPASGVLSNNSSSLSLGSSSYYNMSYDGSTSIYIGFNLNNLSVCSNLITIFSELTSSVLSFTIDQEQETNLLQYISGGAPPYSFTISSKTSISPSIDQSGDYVAGQNLAAFTEADVILVKDQLGQSVTIEAEILTGILVSASQTTIVGNATSQLTVSGGLAPYSYSISSGGGSISSAGLLTAPAVPGSVVVIVSDSGGATKNITVTVIAALSVSPSSTVVLENASQQLVATGGMAPYTYSIATGTGTIDDTGNFSAPSSAETDSILVQDSATPPNSVYSTLIVNGGPANEIDLTQQPGSGNSGNPLSTLPNLEALNSNNEVDQAFNQTVTVAVYDSNCQYPVTTATAQINPATFTNGLLTATSLIVNGSGDITLKFTAGGFSTCSNDFIVTVLPKVLESNAATNCFINNQAIKCWGSNSTEQLAVNASSKTYSYTPVTISGVSTSVSSVIETDLNTCVIDGSNFKCWGSNSSGTFGLNPTIVSETYSPFTVNEVDASDTTLIARADKTVCADVNDSVMCWGDDSYHQLGRGVPTSTNPVVCSSITDLQNTCPQVNGCDSQSDICSNLSSRTSCQNNTSCVWDSTSHFCAPAAADACVGTATDTCSTISDSDVCSNVPSCSWDSIQQQCYDPSLNFNNSSNYIPTEEGADLSGITAIAGGGGTFCAISQNQVYCWGNNSYGQCGIGNEIVDIPTQVSGLSSTVSGLSVGEDHSCAIDTGKVYCWGNDASGQLANGVFSQSVDPVPQLISGLKNIVKVVSGNQFSCGLDSTGSIWCWGLGTQGQLGLSNDYTSVNTPVKINFGTAAIALDLSAGSAHACSLMSDGTLYCWGSNQQGQLGQFVISHYDTAEVISNLNNKGTVSDFQMSSGTVCSLINSQVYCVGLNNNYIISSTNKNTDVLSTPIGQAGLNGLGQVQSFTLNTGGVCSISSTGSAACIGSSQNGVAGDGAAITTGSTYNVNPVLVSGWSTGVTDIIHGLVQSCGIKNGLAYCWGSNINGALGDNDSSDQTITSTPVAVSGLVANVTSIKGYDGNACVLDVNGSVWCWGNGATSLLGSGASSNERLATEVSTLTSGVTEIEMGMKRACAVQSGLVYCWGQDNLGSSTVSSSTVPVQVSGLTGVLSLAIGDEHSCAVQADNTVWCWGQNNAGQLGSSITNVSQSSIPVKVNGVSALKVKAAGSSTCALLTSGSLACWGDNSSSQLGDGSISFKDSPSLVLGL